MAWKAESMTNFWREIILLGFLLLEGVVKGFHVVHPEYMNKEAPAVAWKHRTGYHFQPKKNWINDPNAPMYYNGYYHLFYQYNYKGTCWGNIVWAHSVSEDLVNWKQLKLALVPSKPFDIGGCWSGSATILHPNMIPAILYTGLDKYDNQIQNIAFPTNLSDPFLQDWFKPDYNPIIFPDATVNATNFRDPTTAWIGPDGQWRIVVGTNRNNLGYAALYRSKDFKKWEKTKHNHVLHAVEDIGMWECPDFFPIAMEGEKALDTSTTNHPMKTKYVFKVSLDKTRYEYYSIGTYDHTTDKFVPDDESMDNHKTGLRYDYGNFYASKSFYDAKVGRRILWGWSNESDTSDDDSFKGWAGIQVIPREVWLDRNGKQLVQRPVEEIKKLRLGKQHAVHVQNVSLNAGDIFHVKGFHTSEADVEVTFGLGDDFFLNIQYHININYYNDPQQLCQEVGGRSGAFGLYVLSSQDLRERTAVFFRIFKTSSNSYKLLMCHDINRSSFANSVWKPSFAGFVDVDIAKEKKISIRSLIDNSVVESFGGGGKTCITSRVYPTVAIGGDSHLFAFNNGTAHVHITHLSAWQMKRPLMN